MYSCCCIDYDYDYDTRCFPRLRKAKVSHRCDECGGTINPGEEYEDTRFLDRNLPEGRRWDGIKTCWFCMKIRRDFFSCGFAYGTVRDDFYDCQGWDYMGVWPDQDGGDDD